MKTFYQWLQERWGIFAFAERIYKDPREPGGIIVHTHYPKRLYRLFHRRAVRRVYDPCHEREGIFLEGWQLEELQRRYCDKYDIVSINIDNIKKIQHKLFDPTSTNLAAFKLRIHQAVLLSKDVSNGRKLEKKAGESIDCAQVTSANGLLLELFTELYRHLVSHEDYLRLKSLCAKWSPIDGQHFTQGLKTDSNFIEYLHQYKHHQHDRASVFKFGSPTNRFINEEINTNIDYLLYGEKSVPLGRGRYYEAKRFLPTEQFERAPNNTDEIWIQAGGSSDHYALFKIIKVAMTYDKSHFRQALPGEKIHHFEYYREDYNAGAGGENFKEDRYGTETCDAIVRRKLEPFEFRDSGEPLGKADINVAEEPHRYQKQMSKTLKYMLNAERHVMISKKRSDRHSLESRYYHHYRHRLHRIVKTQCVVHRVRGLAQTKGNCTMASQFHALRAELGDKVTFMYQAFLQTLDSSCQKACINDIQKRIRQTISQAHVKHRPEPYILEPGFDHKVSGIELQGDILQGGYYLVHGENFRGEPRSIEVHADGHIRRFDGSSKPISGYVDSLMKQQVSDIFTYFNVPYPGRPPFILEKGYDHQVTAIEMRGDITQGGFYIVHGENYRGEARSIQIHAGGAIRRFDGSSGPLTGYVASLMKDKLVDILKHFGLDPAKVLQTAQDHSRSRFFTSAGSSHSARHHRQADTQNDYSLS